MIIVNSDYAGDNNDGIIQQRIGTTAEWGNIIPHNGEVIIEITDKKDESGNNIRLARIGDGVKPVSQLPILGLEGGGVGEKTLDGGEIFNTYEDDSESEINKNQAYGKGSHAEGANTVAGAKGFQVNKYIKENNVEYLELKIDNTTLNNIKNYTNTIDNNSFNRYEEVILIIDEQFITDTITIDLKSFTATGANGIVRVLITDYSNENIKTILQSNKVLNYMVLQADTLSPYALTIASFAHAEGCYSVAFGNYSHVENLGNAALGQASHSEGYMTTAIGDFSHTGGQGTIAKGSAQTVIGQYNDPNTEDLFIIGNGDSEDERSNILSVNKDSVTAHKDLNVEQDIDTTNLNVTDNINANSLKVNTVTSNSENSDINIKSKIIAEQGISANGETEFKNITVNEKIEVKDLEVTGEFILSGESTGDLITSDNFKGEAKLSDILNQENPKIGDRWVVSEIDEIAQLEFTDKTNMSAQRLDGEYNQYILDNSMNDETQDTDLEDDYLLLYFHPLETEDENFYKTIQQYVNNGIYYGLKLYIKDKTYEIFINNKDDACANYYFIEDLQRKYSLVEISKPQLQKSKIEFIDILNDLFYKKELPRLTKTHMIYENTDDNTYNFTIATFSNENLIETLDTVYFHFFTNFSDWEQNNVIDQNSGSATKINEDSSEQINTPTFSIINDSNNHYEITIKISKEYDKENFNGTLETLFKDGLFNPKYSDTYADLFEIYYDNMESETYIYTIPKNLSTNVDKTIPTLTLNQVKQINTSSLSYIKPNDQAIWFNNKWNFISAPYQNLSSAKSNLTSLIMNDVNTNDSMGNNSIVGGTNNFNGGASEESLGNNSFIIGNNNNNSGENSIIGGTNNRNSGNSSFITGNNNGNSGKNSIIGGINNFTSEFNSNTIIAGEHNICNHNNNLLIGKYLETCQDNQTLIGQYNEINTSGIFTIGNGTSSLNRNNLLTINTNGIIDFNGIQIQGQQNGLLTLGQNIKNTTKLFKINDYNNDEEYYVIDNVEGLQENMCCFIINEHSFISTIVKITDIISTENNNETKIKTYPYTPLGQGGASRNGNFLLISHNSMIGEIGSYIPAKGTSISAKLDNSFVGIGTNILSLALKNKNPLCIGEHLLAQDKCFLVGQGLVGGTCDGYNEKDIPQVIIGRYNDISFSTLNYAPGQEFLEYSPYSFIVGNGTSDTKRENGLTIHVKGYVEAPQGGFVISDEEGNRYQLYVSSASSGTATIKGKLISEEDYNQ